jgi:hypothetical protein
LPPELPPDCAVRDAPRWLGNVGNALEMLAFSYSLGRHGTGQYGLKRFTKPLLYR